MKQQGSALQPIRTLFTLGTVGTLTDGELLDLFIAGRGEGAEMAFSALVERHGRMVLRVCRSILRDEHNAQDAFQATFLVLVDRAGSVRDRSSVASWLHGVALRVAACGRASVARRRMHERRAADRAAACDHAGGAEPDLAPTLHEEVGRLSERFRVPIVLCYLEGLACEEAAQRLGIPVGTVKSRLARGRERLRARLIRRGFAPSVVFLISTFSDATGSAAMPATVALSTIRIAARFSKEGTLTGVVPAAVRLLTEGALKAMDWNRFRLIAHGVMAAAIITVCVGGVAQVVSDGGDARPQADVPKRPAAVAQATEAEAQSPERLLSRSRDVIEKLEPSFKKARLFSELATAQAELKYDKAARETGRRAVETVLALDEKQDVSMFAQQQTTELREAAKALAAAGDVEAALAAEEKIGIASSYARSHREFVLQEVGEALVKSGFLDEAKHVMSVMRKRGIKTDIVAWFLASAQAKAGEVRVAMQTADSISDDLFRVASLVGISFDASTYYDELDGGIALAQWRAGDRAGADETLRRAIAVADRAADPKAKGICLGLIARAKLKMGDLSGAVQMARAILDDSGRDRATVDIVTAYAALGRWDDAMNGIESIRGNDRRLVALCRVAKARGKAKDTASARKLFAQALEIAKDLKLNGEHDPTGPYHIAVAQAESGDYRAARETLRGHREYPSADDEAEVLAMVYARSGQFFGALLSLESLPRMSDDTRSNLLREIVKLQIESTDEQQAFDVLERFESPICEARVLMGIARGLTAAKRARDKVDANRVP